MNNKISLKGRLVAAVLALVMLVTSLLGTTFAWFTDSATSGSNVITAGRLDVNMYWSDTLLAVDSTEWKHADGVDLDVFSHENWEPGYTEVKYVKIANEGSLDLKWQLSLEVEDEIGKLAEVIDVYYVNPATSEVTSLAGLTTAGTLDKVISSHKSTSGTLLEEDGQDSVIIAIAMHMQESAGNEYQAESVSGIAGFKLHLVATQYSSESDSFGSDYDKDATFPTDNPTGSVSVSLEGKDADADGKLDSALSVEMPNGIKATFPAGTKYTDGADKIVVSVDDMATSSNILVENGEEVRSIDVHAEGVSEDNTVPAVFSIPKTMPVGLNIGNYRLYHVEDGNANQMNSTATPTDHNDFYYDPATGDMTVAMATYSEVAVVAETVNAWEGNFDYSWYTNATAPVAEGDPDYVIANADQLAAFGAIVGGMNGQTKDSFEGKTVKLLADVNLGDEESENNPNLIFYPIGYYNSEGTYERTNTAITSGLRNFEGTFDGNGNTISNFYHNTWEMKGDHDWYSPEEQYYRDGMGLFGKVYGGTVKNLTVDNFSSDGEIATTGVIAAYADGATFENIAITNCNPRVYNIGNGGIVGCVGWYAKEANLKTTFKNITVDNSNKISALWGSYDVACGGIVGQYYPTSGQTSAGTPKNGGVSFDNCHVSAQMDVYNDVCANYQYYAYRYTGMLIGSVRENTTDDNGKTIPKMDGITANNSTVNYGTWNAYYYCELVANTLASYTHDHQMSRLTQVDSVDVANKTYTVTVDGKSVTKDIPASGRVNYVVVNGSHSTENATCYHFVDGKVWNHNDAGTETVNGATVLKEDKQHLYLPFVDQIVTGYGWGVDSRGIAELEGIMNITEGDQEESVVKFETKFTGDFLYRVGNKNTVSIGSLFAAKEGATIISSGVWVKVEKLDKNMNVSGTFTANTTDWTKGTIKFEGTGVVKVTIQDYNFCTPTVLYLEVVDATNYASTSISSLGSGNVALLCNTKLNQNGALALQNASLYGNGFTIDVTAGRTRGESISANYMLYMNNATIDNVQIIGAVYTNFSIESDQEWNSPVIFSIGNSTIANSLVANCASAVRLGGGNLNIINSTLKGGFFANLEIHGGSVVLDNVTTINQENLNDKAANDEDIVGLGIVVYYEGPTEKTMITVKGQLTQYNYLANKQTSNGYANMLINEIFNNKEKYADFIYTDANDKEWANTGILSLSRVVGEGNIVIDAQTNKSEYLGSTVSISNTMLPSGSATGYLYASNPKTLCESYEFVPAAQYEIVPKVSFDHSVNELPKTEDNETSCTADALTDQEHITFADGGSFEWNVNILKSANKDITYTVWIDGVQYTDTIVFDESGEHTVVFKYSDANNYRLNGNEVVQYTVEYEISMVVVVTEKEPDAKSAEITFPLLQDSGTTTVVVDGKTYIMPNLVGKSTPQYDASFGTGSRNYGSVKVDGRSSTDIYYPIIKTKAVTEKVIYNYMVYPVFGNENGTLVQIQDYADRGVGEALTPYNASTQTMPTGLSVVRGYTIQWKTDSEVVGSGSMSYGGWVAGTGCMQYQTKAGTSIDCGVKGNYLSYYPNIDIRSNDRNEQIQVVEYQYVDNKGDTYYYCVGYHIEERNSGYAFGETVPEDSGGSSPCVTPDTLVTLADGTQKRIDQVKYDDQLLVWNFYTGKYDFAPAAIIFDHGYDNNTVIALNFSNGTTVKVVNLHQFFDADLNKYVSIDADSVANYVGHKFAKSNGNGFETVTLVDYSVSNEYVEAWGIISAEHYNIIVEGMLSTDFMLEDYDLFNYFAVGKDMKFDSEQMQADIDKYGLYTYDDFADYLTYEQFVAFNVQYFKIPVEKGLYTYEGILALIDEYLNK